jgi:hypothetical protein
VWYLALRTKLNLIGKDNLMRASRPWNLPPTSIGHLWALLIDSLGAVGAFAIMGLMALIVHKSAERLQLWGVPSDFIEGVEALHVCIWVINALAVLWLCGSAVIKFCERVKRY